MVRKVRIVLVGLGNVNLGLLKILEEKEKEIINLYNLQFKIVGIVDSSGMAIRPGGFGYRELINLKFNKKKVNEIIEFLPNSIEKLAECVEADLLIESSPVNLKSDNSSLHLLKNALQVGWHVVLANKAPLVLEFDKLHQIASDKNVKILYSATVCGGLPVINVLNRDLKFATLERLHGIFNATSNFVLQEMENGIDIEEAIKEAQKIGAAETDPTLDLSGQDAANKLYIIMKSFSDFNGTIADIEIEGIERISKEEIRKSAETNTKIKLVASAHRQNNKWKLSVKPTLLSRDSFMGSCNGWEMGIEVKTDLYESISLKNYEADPKGTSAAVLRDMIDLLKEAP